MAAPAVFPSAWPRRMPVEIAAAYCGERTVRAFMRRVGTEYPAPKIAQGRRRLWLKDDLDRAIGPPRAAEAADAAEDL